jgi:hypothetical protein
MLCSCIGPMLTRAEDLEVLAEEALARLEVDVRAALRRRPAQEAKLAGVVRTLSRYSPRLRSLLLSALETMVRRGSYQRPLYSAAVRALAEHNDRQAGGHLCRALLTDDAGGLSTLSAACLTSDGALSQPLAKLATSRHSHVAFAAEVARIARGESDGAHVASIAPKIKESHRIALCLELFVPLLWQPPISVAIAQALGVLRDAERHLGRWLVLGEIAVRAGDSRPLDEAKQRAATGPESARAAWTLVAWALDPRAAPPHVRPTVELVARLSDRPSADRDTTFLFRLAAAGVPSARAMLEGIARGAALTDETAVRAALHLARDYGESRYVEQLSEATRAPRKELLRGIAAAALFDAGECTLPSQVAAELGGSRHLPALAWSGLIRAAAAGLHRGAIVTEASFRRIQLGWVE